MTDRFHRKSAREMEIDREILRENIQEAVAMVAAVAVAVLLGWAYLRTTPPQLSAEAEFDIAQQELVTD